MEEKYVRQYVGMDVFYTPDGDIIPKKVYWPDGRSFEVTFINKSKGSAKKAGGSGDDYEVDVYGEEYTYRRHLFLVDDRWFVEVKAPA